MKKFIPLILSTLVILLVVSCGEDDPLEEAGFTLNGTNINMADIAGTWEATSAIFSNAATGPVQDIQIVEGAGYFVLTIETNGEFYATYYHDVPGFIPQSSEGVLRFDEDLLVLAFEEDLEDWLYFSINHNEPVLNLSGGPVEETIDFDDNGSLDAAYLNLEFERTS